MTDIIINRDHTHHLRLYAALLLGMITESRPARKTCIHCGDICENGGQFCCGGCETVYTLLQENGLCQYYTLNKNPGKAQRIAVRKDKFLFLDDDRTQQQLLQFRDNTVTNVTFHIPAIHCSSCLWLLENLRKLDAGVQQVEVNFSRKEARIIYRHGETSMRKIVETLAGIGYEPYISLQDLRPAKKTLNRKLIYQLGVAGFCFANIMLLSFPEYFSRPGHMEENMTVIFRYLTLILSLPVVFYSAQAFYTPAWNGLKHGHLNIDAPVVLAIFVTFARSIAEVASGAGAGYFDSMTGIVLFMLTGRWLQEKTYEGLAFDRDYTAYFPLAVSVLKDRNAEPVRLPEVKTGDTLLVHHQELIPADGILVRGKALIDYSFVTGESTPVNKQTGEIIYAGGRQLGGNMELLVVKEVAQSYLTSLWNRKELREEQPEKTSFIHLLGKYFSWVVFAIAAITAAYWAFNDPAKIWPSVTAILIIACPCALLLAASFTNGHILRILSRHRLYLRNAQAIENMAGATHIVFDKTGTLTGKQNTVTEWKGRRLSRAEKKAVAALSASSQHPLSIQIRKYLGNVDGYTVKRFSEQPGMGIQGWAGDMHIQLGSAAYTGAGEPKGTRGSVVHLNINGDNAGYFIIRHTYRNGMDDMFRSLQKHFRLSLISGDQPGEAGNLRKMMGEEAVLRFRQQAHDKLDYIQELRKNGEHVLMIGDGLNDAGALKQSNTGISLTEDSNNFTPASDGILEASRLHRLPDFIRLCRSGKRIILSSFVYSTIYNLTGLYFAVQGKLSPLIAAILMPLSSISIIILTYLMSEWAGRKIPADQDHKTR